jgi:hypothetical protein
MKLVPSYLIALGLLAIAITDGAFQLYSAIGRHLLEVTR